MWKSRKRRKVLAPAEGAEGEAKAKFESGGSAGDKSNLAGAKSKAAISSPLNRSI